MALNGGEGRAQYKPAKRSLGQNFLADANIARKIVDSLDIQPGDNVLEIGPGRGALTRHILNRRPGRFMVLEKDDDLAQALTAQYPSIELVAGDALAFPWQTLEPEAGWKIVGNLPYNIASPLIWDIVSQAALSAAVFMVQLEVGQRLKAPHGGKDYGALSVWVQSHARVELLFKVPPQVFHPQPKVTSAVMRFFLLPRQLDQDTAKALAATLRMCFQQRRKQLGTILKSKGIVGAEELLQGLGIQPAQRPETLEPERFQALSNRLGNQFGS
ncbi:MAG: ribosomal RNA small subunit methyltransferase A [Deltaproteobacteria bacterium HGW-Deltaproteobacteria-8]|jgi:16S rRNA (adenine1518-N6/adenine1519-N6)-dimethyltransferase|nr:MAG: ribosomal RNA small subunit methyltransferase A [Deltaproteobacteria bacterium HGW-Deltaproteobacteria-8]